MPDPRLGRMRWACAASEVRARELARLDRLDRDPLRALAAEAVTKRVERLLVEAPAVRDMTDRGLVDALARRVRVRVRRLPGGEGDLRRELRGRRLGQRRDDHRVRA